MALDKMGGALGYGASGSSCPVTLQMELKALKDQLEAERQAWVASCAKKEVGSRRVGSKYTASLDLLLGVTPGYLGLSCSSPAMCHSLLSP